MNHARFLVITMLACAAMLVSGAVGAQARDPFAATARQVVKVDPAIARAATLEKLDIWLRRLVGRFRITSLIAAEGVPNPEGWVDCVAIGSGAGVHCVLSTQPLSEARRVAPTMVLYGVDPGAPGIRYLQVDDQSLAEGDVGKLSGERIIFRAERPIIPREPKPETTEVVISCDREVLIYAPSSGKFLHVEDSKVERVRTCIGGLDTPRTCETTDQQVDSRMLVLQREPEDRATAPSGARR